MGRRKKSPFKTLIINHAVYLAFRVWIFLTKRLAIKSLRFYGEKGGRIAFYILVSVRRTALNNLQLAFGKEKSRKEIKRICLNTFKNIGWDMMENVRGLDYDDSYLKTLVSLEGKEHLDKALAQGKGVIALSAHFGNFPLMGYRLVKEGYPLTIVTRVTKNPKVLGFVNSVKDVSGIRTIPVKPRFACVAQCLNTLKANRVLMLQMDLNAPITEAWVDFFGYEVPTYKGPVVFSLRTEAPILPMFITRKHLYHRIVIHPPFSINTNGNNQEDITLNTARLTKFLETVIRESPEQWWWSQPRFKKARNIKTGEPLFPKRPDGSSLYRKKVYRHP